MMQVPSISLANFDSERERIKRELVHAAETMGFFVIKDQARPSKQEIETIFDQSKAFFSQPDTVKQKTPHVKTENTGWERNAQIRPSTGTPDQKESIQLQYARRHDNWPTYSSEFQAVASEFMLSCQELSSKLMSCLAEALGFDADFFIKAHQIELPSSLTTLRLLHYQDISGTTLPNNYWRAGPHTDFSLLTLLFQRTGEDGLEVCPGRSTHTSFGFGDQWAPVPAETGQIAINIGDMLMAWSDDRFKSNFHRVRAPGIGEGQKSRYSIAYFNQANKDIVIQGPLKKYDPMTAAEYISTAMDRNFREANGERPSSVVVQ